MPKKNFEVQWDDTDSDFPFDDSQTDTENEFSDLLASESAPKLNDAEDLALDLGSKVDALISYIGKDSDDVLLDLGLKTTGIIAKNDLLDENLELNYKVGDIVTAYIISFTEDEITLSKDFSQSSSKSDALEAAYRDQIPVTAKVTGTNKGGFELSVFGRKAFCPISQIDSKFVSDPLAYVGKDLDFLVQKLDSRDLVLSRTALLSKHSSRRLEEIRRLCEDEEALEGEITEVLDFGAVVELGGINGFVHISQLGFKHLHKASEALQVGQIVTVKVLKIDESQKHPRISLSMKALANDPWENIQNQFTIDKSYSGTIIRLADFGAFVELSPGIDGLIHLSQMSWEKRIHHPREILKEGDSVSVRVIEINPLEKRLSLSLKDLNDDPWLQVQARFTKGSEHLGRVLELRSFGAILELEPGISGLLPLSLAKEAFGAKFRKELEKDKTLKVSIVECSMVSRKIVLCLPGQDQRNEEAEDIERYLQKQNTPTKEKSESDTGSFGRMLEASFKKTTK